MSITEILEELPKLNTEDRCTLWQQLSKLENTETISASPEMLAAIDEGLRSLETEPRYTIEDALKKVEQCARKSR